MFKIQGVHRDRLDAVLMSWEGTPRMAGQRCRGVGADCAGFVAGVLEELAGYPMGTVPLESDFQTRKSSVVSFKAFLDAFPAEVLEDVAIEPGDVLIVGRSTQGLEHAMFVGNKYLWHCGIRGVCKTGTSLQGSMVVKKILRYKDKETW